MTKRGIRSAAREQVRIFLQVAREHRQHLMLACRKRDDLLDPVRPIRFAAQMIDHHDPRMLQHVLDIEIDRGWLPQVSDIRETHAWKAIA